MKWLRKFLRLGGWRYRAAALRKQEVLAKENPQAIAAGFSLTDGLLNRKNICKRCYSIYTPQKYEFAERFMVKSILRVPDSEPDPMLCDFCFKSVQQEVNREWTNVGTSNFGPPNLALRRLVDNS